MFRPTLAVSIDFEDQIGELLKRFETLFVSEKKDGIRGIADHGMQSREAKRIPNKRIQHHFRHLPDGLDGEMMFWIDGMNGWHPPLEHINSVITSDDKPWPKRWTPMFHAFDYQYLNGTFRERYKFLREHRSRFPEILHVERQTEERTERDVLDIFDEVVESGGEGICLRNPDSYYKEGRSTLKDGCLMRLKKLIRDIAMVYGYTALERHVGAQKRNAFGLAKRDGKKENLETVEEIGALLAVHEKLGRFKVGSGFTADERKKFYLKGKKLVGKEFYFEYRDTTHKGVPRNPTFVRMV